MSLQNGDLSEKKREMCQTENRKFNVQEIIIVTRCMVTEHMIDSFRNKINHLKLQQCLQMLMMTVFRMGKANNQNQTISHKLQLL